MGINLFILYWLNGNTRLLNNLKGWGYSEKYKLMSGSQYTGHYETRIMFPSVEMPFY
jgi:hypothetical protein